ncbi:hypothetical protein FKP32DRAFT_1001808 [Trametes sanguinea]|nr:hypothetical protein FKP32DRAFT_1001808 [Trametes sanguinea]
MTATTGSVHGHCTRTRLGNSWATSWQLVRTSAVMSDGRTTTRYAERRGRGGSIRAGAGGTWGGPGYSTFRLDGTYRRCERERYRRNAGTESPDAFSGRRSSRGTRRSYYARSPLSQCLRGLRLKHGSRARKSRIRSSRSKPARKTLNRPDTLLSSLSLIPLCPLTSRSPTVCLRIGQVEERGRLA